MALPAAVENTMNIVQKTQCDAYTVFVSVARTETACVQHRSLGHL